MVELGVWQIHRLEGRRQINTMLESRMHASAIPISNLVTPATSSAIANHHEFRRVVATGHYDLADQVVVGPESDADGNPGWWLLTPLVLADHTAVVVNRGLIPYDAWPNTGGSTSDNLAALHAYDPPLGTVTVTGLVAESQRRTGGLRDAPTGHLNELARADLTRYQRQIPDPIDPVYIDLTASKPSQATAYPQPRAAPRPQRRTSPQLRHPMVPVHRHHRHAVPGPVATALPP